MILVKFRVTFESETSSNDMEKLFDCTKGEIEFGERFK
jgi:hypothetical protein